MLAILEKVRHLPISIDLFSTKPSEKINSYTKKKFKASEDNNTRNIKFLKKYSSKL